MKVGFGKQEIYLKPPIYTCWSQEKKADEIIDGIYAYVTVVEDKRNKCALFTLDVLCIPYSFTLELRKELKIIGFNPQAISISATHSHTAPVFGYLRGCPRMIGLKEAIKKACLKATEEALENMEESSIYWTKTRCDININRRQIGRFMQINDINAPSGKVDDEISVLVFRRKRDDIILVNYSAHPITITKNMNLISSDFPGKLVIFLEEKLSKTKVQFLQGASGNLNIKIHGDAETTRKVARAIGGKVLEAMNKIKKISSPELEAKIERIKLPLDIKGTLKDLRKASESNDRYIREWSKEVKDKTRKKEIPRHRMGEIQKISFGDFTIIFLPGEPFFEIGKKIKKLGAGMVAGFSNMEDAGYIPTKEAFREGGYEPDISYRVYDTWKYSPKVEEIVLKYAQRIIEN